MLKDIKIDKNKNYNIKYDYNIFNNINKKFTNLYDVNVNKVLQLNDVNDIKFFENVKETIGTLKDKLQNKKQFKDEFAIILELEEYFNKKNIEELSEEELEHLKLKIKDIFVNTLYKNINNKKELIKKETLQKNINVYINTKKLLEEKAGSILTGENIIIDFTELFFETTQNLAIIMTNTFFNKLKEQTIKNIQLNLENKYLNLEKIDKEILIKKLEKQEQTINKLNKEIEQLQKEKQVLLQQKKDLQKQLKNNNNKQLKEQLNKLIQYIKQIEKEQQKLKNEIKKEREKIKLYEFNIKASNTYTLNIVKQKENRKLDLHPAFDLTPKPSKKQKLKM